MIIIDLETSGIDPLKHQTLSIGAVDYDNGETFYGECYLLKHKKWTQSALDINGFTIDDLFDRTKMSPTKLYHKFLKWCQGRSVVLAGHNIGSFDLQFLRSMHNNQRKIEIFPFSFRTVDLHSIAYNKFENKSYSMNKICELIGIEPEPNPHNALNGALKEYECFKYLMNV